MAIDVSFIIPVYNCEKYIRNTVRSIQEWTGNNIEIILVDDGSTDGSPALCDELAKEECRVVVIHQRNKGVSAARNAGMQCAKGNYLWFVDGDDTISSHACEMLADFIPQCTYEIISFGWSILEDGQCVEQMNAPRFETQQLKDLNMIFDMQEHYFSSACNKLWLARWLRNTNVHFDETCTNNEDTIFCYQAYLHANYILNLPDCLYEYHQHAQSVSHKPLTNIMQMYEYREPFLKKLLDGIIEDETSKIQILQKQRGNALLVQMELAQMHPTMENKRRKQVLHKLFYNKKDKKLLLKRVTMLPFSIHKVMDIISIVSNIPEICLIQFSVLRYLRKQLKIH